MKTGLSILISVEKR